MTVGFLAGASCKKESGSPRTDPKDVVAAADAAKGSGTTGASTPIDRTPIPGFDVGILDAAERVFAQRGFYAAKVAAIAKEAGVADGTIYLYFKNKDDLLITLFESRMERVIQILGDAVASVVGPGAQLRAFVRAYLALIADQPTAAEVLTIELRQSTKFMREYSPHRFGELLRMLAGVVAAGQASGEFTAAVPAPLSLIHISEPTRPY